MSHHIPKWAKSTWPEIDFIAENETSLCPPPYNEIHILYVTYFGQKFERKNGPSYLFFFYL